MTSDAFRAALDRLGMSQVGLARALDVDQRTVRRWAAGQAPIPKAVQMLLEGKSLSDTHTD